MKEEIADFIHDREHPYWDNARRSVDFCTEIMLEVRAAQAIALATKTASEDDGDEDRAVRAHRFSRACQMALGDLQIIAKANSKRESRKDKKERARLHKETMLAQEALKIEKKRIAQETHALSIASTVETWKRVAICLARELRDIGRTNILDALTVDGRPFTEILKGMDAAHALKNGDTLPT